MYQTPKGTRDTTPEEMIRTNSVLSVVKNVFEKYCFDPMDTPAFEDWALLSAKQGGGEEIKKEIYYFRDKSDRELGLRFDLTVPFCRFVASSQDIPKPFKRYQIGKVWRYDNPGALRWREFLQADADIAGSDSMEAEAECINAACDILHVLGFSDFIIRLSNRKITEEYIRSLGVSDVVSVFRVIDKLDKIGPGGVENELESKKIPKDAIKKILVFIKLSDISQIKKKVVCEGIEELEKIIALTKNYEKNIRVDMSLVRGLEYYTGPVFEISLSSSASVGGGGRYDSMIETLGGKKTPAVGISIGIDRLLAVMGESKEQEMQKSVAQVFVVSVNASVKETVLKIVENLRSFGIRAECDIMFRSLSKQLQYANSKSIPFSMVVGEKEIQKGMAILRDMRSGFGREVGIFEAEEISKAISK